ncbi:hypothetical protein CA54_14500 [Symmachiella macrocystis]|uniref:YdjC-like protein n=1 Tax=Symmachiella macrocystis TaxID=2527985 RepID=A0A5C6BMV5_9PLAN|nr:ChbG/HpnK family deacetylase [Symmachiella macrocystis]TWU12626.1 hypothetical protein CA54_14500 [Symmachiella macrocystis]
MKQLIINADDLGICESANHAIQRSFTDGVLTSASLMAIGPAFDHAVATVVNPFPDLGIGLHVCLTSGRCLTPPNKIGQLADENGRLRVGFAGLCRLAMTNDGRIQIERELDAQFQHIVDAGLVIDHVNSHRHVHMIPGIFSILARLATKYGCPAIRVSDERIRRRANLFSPSRMITTLSNAPKQMILGMFATRARKHGHSLLTCDRTFGILGSGKMNLAAMSAVVTATTVGTYEVITHPGELVNALNDELSQGDRRFWNSSFRNQELQALLDPRFKAWMEINHVQPARYADIACLASNRKVCPLSEQQGSDENAPQVDCGASAKTGNHKHN